jgi:hypothetical protein
MSDIDLPASQSESAAESVLYAAHLCESQTTEPPAEPELVDGVKVGAVNE